MTLELIIWDDITSHFGGEWFDISDLKDKDLTRFYTAGVVVYEDEKLIKVVGTVDRETGAGHDTVIPKGCIASRKVLRRNKSWQQVT